MTSSSPRTKAADAFDDAGVQCIQLQMPHHLQLTPEDWVDRAHWAPRPQYRVKHRLQFSVFDSATLTPSATTTFTTAVKAKIFCGGFDLAAPS